MSGNQVHSAPVLSRMLVENLHPEYAHTPQQKETWAWKFTTLSDPEPGAKELPAPFGPCGIYYRTCHGVLPQSQVFATKEELLASL